jgi:hypothetical protein
MEKPLFFNFIYTTYKINAGVTIEPLCNAFTAINVGTSIAYINGVPLNPGTPGTNNGESISQGGNRAEILQGRIDVGFSAQTGNSLIIIQKIYLPGQF